jgi:hypothetical protein
LRPNLQAEMLFFIFLFALIINILATLVAAIIRLDKIGVFTYTVKDWEISVRQSNFS